MKNEQVGRVAYGRSDTVVPLRLERGHETILTIR